MTILRALASPTPCWRASVLCLALCSALPAAAERSTIGPALDFVGSVSTIAPNTTLSTHTTQFVQYTYSSGSSGTFPNIIIWAAWSPTPPLLPCTPAPYNGCLPFTFIDQVNASPLRAAQGASEIGVKGLSYFSMETSQPDQVQITTLYGVNDPQGSRLSMTGFDPVGPALEINGEKIIGRSGAVFTPTSASVLTLEQLPSSLGPGFDTSMIWGNPHEYVYRFQTIVPLAEVAAVPEPAGALLLVLGLATVVGVRRRHLQSD